MTVSVTGVRPSSEPARTHTPSTGPCPCGCRECDDTCCGLDCLVQPRFFHGQLLSDRDLNALLRWTQDKQRLVRYRDGWGVVCGLDIWCDPKRPNGIIVGTGYALSCCGDDILVCEPTPFDLQRPCCGGRDPDCGCGARTAVKGAAPQTSRQAYDIILRYVEQPSEPQPALRRGYVNDGGACDFGRIRETFQIAAVVTDDDDPVRSGVRRWQDAYGRCLEVLSAFPESLLDGDSDGDGSRVVGHRADGVRRWFLWWLDDHPLRRFCWVRDEICAIVDEVEVGQVLRWLFLLVQDCRLEYLAGCTDACGCDDHSGVRIGRVWVETEGGRCRIDCIDPMPPFRRELSRDAFPSDPGHHNVGRIVWRRAEDAIGALASTGLESDLRVTFDPASLGSVNELRDELAAGTLVVDADTTWRPRIWSSDRDCDGDRFVDLVRGTKSSPTTTTPDRQEKERGSDVTGYERTEVGTAPTAHDPRTATAVGTGTDQTNDTGPVVRPRVPDGRTRLSKPPRRRGRGRNPEPIAPLTDVEGIGEARARRLRAAGISDVRALAAADLPAIRAAVPGLNEATAVRWRERARARIR